MLRALAASSLTALSPRAWDLMFQLVRPVLPKRFITKQAGDKLHKLAGILEASGPGSIYFDLISHWKRPAGLVHGSVEPETVLTSPHCWADGMAFEHVMMYLDSLSYLPDDILAKVDRAAMAASLETRVPFLDQRVVELAWSLPLHFKIRDGQGKWILRQVLYKYIPKELVERPKMGFGVPIDAWLRGPLRDWAEALLDRARLTREGLLEAEPIREKWREHLSGQRNWQYYLWDVLMFQAWYEAQQGSAYRQ